MNQWSIAARQIQQNPLRSLLMAVGVALFALVIVSVTLVMVGINQSISQTVDRLGADLMLIPQGDQIATQFNEALITGKPTRFYLAQALAQSVGELEYVDKVTTQTYAQTLTNARCCAGNFFLIGFDRASDFTVQPWLTHRVETWPQDSEDWIIVGDRILLGLGEQVKLYGSSFKVAGVLGPTGTGMDWSIYCPDPALRRLVRSSVTQAEFPLHIADEQVSTILIRAQAGTDLIDLAERLEQAHPKVQAVLSSSVGKLARNQLKVIALISLWVVGVLWLIAALLSGVVFSQAIRERQGEIGLFLAKGAHRSFILGMLSKESLIVSTVSSLCGAAAALVIVGSFQQLLAASLGVPNVLPHAATTTALVLGLCTFGTVSALLCSLLPALGMLRMEPYEAIKRGKTA
jgi:putative ABC transport system permease protein